MPATAQTGFNMSPMHVHVHPIQYTNPRTSTWPRLRCDVGLEEGNIQKTVCVLQCCVLLWRCTNVRAVPTGRLNVSGFRHAWFSSVFQAPLYLLSSWRYIDIENFFVLTVHPFLYLLVSWAEHGEIGPWPGWLTIVIQCYDTVGWVIWPVISFPKWPITCQVGR